MPKGTETVRVIRKAKVDKLKPASGPAQGTYSTGTEEWRFLREKVDSGEFELFRNDEAGTAWIYDGETFWTYDDETAVSQKTEWALGSGYSGVMVWAIDGDDADGSLMASIDAALRAGRP